MDTDADRKAFQDLEEPPSEPAHRTDARAEQVHCLVLLSPEFGDKVVPLRAGEGASIGRKATNMIVIPDLRVSGSHAEVFECAGQFWVRDLRSQNGTSVNGARLNGAPVQLKPSDRIDIAGVAQIHFTDKQIRRGTGAPADPPSMAKTRRFVIDGACSLAGTPATGTDASSAARAHAGAAGAEAAGRIEREVERRVGERFAETAQLARERGALLAMAAHDLSVPIRGMLDHLGTLVPRVAGDPRAAWIACELAVVRENAEGVLELLEDLLDRRRAESGELQLALEPVDLGAWLSEMRGLYERWTAGAGRRVELELAGALPIVPIDKRRMAQILNNLLYEALKHTPRGGVVTIEARCGASGREVEVSVGNHGGSFNGTDTDRMLALFAKGAPVEEPAAGPAPGLGLAIVEQLVRLHGGTLRTDDGPGRGPRFTVALPLSPPTDPGPRARP